jgi:indole-3-glycerol phosphate synthase
MIMPKGKSKLEKLREDKVRLMEEQRIATLKVRDIDAAIVQEERAELLAEVEKASGKHGTQGLAKLIEKANELGVDEILKRLA